MNIDITEFFNNARMIDYSASAAEIRQDAVQVTWGAAMADSAEYPLLRTEAERQEYRDNLREYGAWDDAEVNGMTDQQLNALCMQFVAGDIRESGLTPGSTGADWCEAHDSGDAGRLCQSAYGRIYYYVGS